MKLCRFELASSPGQARSGIVYSGKIYETDGANPIAVHEAADVRPLPPVGVPPALRMFRNPEMYGRILGVDEAEDVPYLYGNPASLVGASQVIVQPDFALKLRQETYIAAIIGQPCFQVPLEHADEVLLGYTIMSVFVAENVLRISASARAFDFAIALGPVLTTPDDLEEHVAEASYGRRYKLEVATRVNGVELDRANTDQLPITMAQAVSLCSQGIALQSADLIAIGPLLSQGVSMPDLEPGDEISVAVENLGTLSTKISTSTSAL